MLIPASEIIKQSIALYKKYFSVFLPYLLSLWAIATFAIIISIIGIILEVSGTTALVLDLIISFILYVFAIVLLIPFIRNVYLILTGYSSQPLKEGIKDGFSLLIPYFIVFLLSGLYILGGFLLLIVPMFIFALWYSYSFNALILENKRGKKALQYSKELIKGRSLQVLWRLAAPTLLFGIVLIIVDIIFNQIIGLTVANMSSENMLIITVGFFKFLISFINIIVSLIVTIGTTILYVDLKKKSLITQKTA